MLKSDRNCSSFYMFCHSEFALIFLPSGEKCLSLLFVLLGSGSWNICVTNPESLSQKQVTWIRYIFFLLAKISQEHPSSICLNLTRGLFFLTSTDNRVSLPLFDYYTFGLLLGRGEITVRHSVPPVSVWSRFLMSVTSLGLSVSDVAYHCLFHFGFEQEIKTLKFHVHFLSE